MKTRSVQLIFTLLTLFTLSQGVFAGQTISMQVAANNPCAMKGQNPCNPCANPCAKNAKNACNPCAKKVKNACNPCDKEMHNPCNPCGKKMYNPCGKNPCGKGKNPCGSAAKKIDSKKVLRPAGVKLFAKGPRNKLTGYGAKLFKDTSLSSNGLSCNDCHATNDLFNASFNKPYPHKVSMAKERAGVTRNLSADEFVQFCMMAPMATKPLPWRSRELAALAAYVEDVKQPAFRKWAQKNPCALKGKGMRGANPCNPCNPCAGKMAMNPCKKGAK